MLGKAQVCDYFENNKTRQDDLQVFWEPIRLSESEGEWVFFSSFFDNNEGAGQAVLGHMVFRLSDSGKIIRIDENYRVDEGKRIGKIKYPWSADFWFFLERLSISRLIWWLIKAFTIVYISALLISGLLLLLSITTSIPAETLNLWSNACDENAFDDKVCLTNTETQSLFLGALGATGALSVIVLMLQAYAKSLGGVKRYSLRNKTSEVILAKILRKADSATLFGGDFSFIKNSERLMKSLELLAESGTLKFISCRSESEVRTSLFSSSRAIKIINRLETQGDIKFQANSNNLRVSLVKAKGFNSIVVKKGGDVVQIRSIDGAEELFSLIGDVAVNAS